MNIVFDFGAVLFDWRPVERVRRWLSPEAASSLAGTLARDIFLHADWLDFDCGRLDLDTVIDRTAVRLCMPRDRLHALLAPIGRDLEPIAPNVAVLLHLARRRDRHERPCLYFLSNMPQPFARELEQRHDFLRLFDGGVFSGDVRLGKPDPAIYRLLGQRHRLQPEQTWFVDDHLANVEAACDLGWQGLHLTQPLELRSLLRKSLGDDLGL